MGGAAYLLEVYRAQLRLWISTQLQYRVALVIWLIGMVLQPVISLMVWSTVARSSGGRVGGLAAPELAGYFIVSMLVNHVTFTWIMWEFETRIRLGQFSPKLLRPVHPIHSDVADNVTYKLLTLVVMIPAAIGLTLAFRPALHPDPWAVFIAVPAVALAFALRFVLEWTIALAAFWTTRVAAVNDAYEVLVYFLAGALAPLSVLPPAAQHIAAGLPFRWFLAFPTELIIGRLTLGQAVTGLGIQALWLALGLAVLSAVWRLGLQRYTAVGA